MSRALYFLVNSILPGTNNINPTLFLFVLEIFAQTWILPLAVYFFYLGTLIKFYIKIYLIGDILESNKETKLFTFAIIIAYSWANII